MTPLKALLLIAVFVALAVWAGHWMMQRVRGDRVAPTPEESARIEAARRQPQVVATAQRPPPTVPITLRLGCTSLWPTVSWFIGWWFGALSLWGEPTLRWTRWLRWREVGAVRQVDELRRYATRGGSNAPTTTRAARQWLHFLDAAGQPLIAIDAPLRPAADYQALLDAVPTWTGRPLTREERGA